MPTELTVRHAGRQYRVAMSRPIDLAIPMTDSADSPTFFGAEPAHSVPMRTGEFVGDTTAGGSCNVRTWNVNPHCHGTHTESIGHLTDDPVPVGPLAPSMPMLADLFTVDFAADGSIDERALAEHPSEACDALILRMRQTSPSMRYPVLPGSAMQKIAATHINHLLVETPSLDREDDPRLVNHRTYWGLPETARRSSAAAFPARTITEFVQIPPSIADGLYLLCLGVAHWSSDAAPSRPTLFALKSAADDD